MTAADSARWWLRLAWGDLAGATAIIAAGTAPPRHAAYLAHQAVEKVLKAAIAASGRAPAPSHDLVGLHAASPDSLREAVPAEALRPLVHVDLVARYPGDVGELVDREDAEPIVSAATDVIGRLMGVLEGAGIATDELEAA